MKKLTSVALAIGLMSGSAFAQGVMPKPGAASNGTSSAPATTSAAPKVERTAKSKECSMEADKQGLHGKARKAFRNKCKHG